MCFQWLLISAIRKKDESVFIIFTILCHRYLGYLSIIKLDIFRHVSSLFLHNSEFK